MTPTASCIVGPHCSPAIHRDNPYWGLLPISFLHSHASTEAHSASASLPTRRILLHLLADLDVNLEKLGHAAVQAHGLARVELPLAIVGRYALLDARLCQPRWKMSERRGGVLRAERAAVPGPTDLLNMSETISISVSAAAIFSADVGWGRPPPKRKDMLARRSLGWVEVVLVMQLRTAGVGTQKLLLAWLRMWKTIGTGDIAFNNYVSEC